MKWYAAYFGNTDWLESTWLSVWIAGCVVLLSTTLGTLSAIGILRLPPRLRVVATVLILSPLIVPVIVVAIGIYYTFSRYGLVGTPIAVVLAHTCLAVPFVVTSVTASLAGIDPRLEQAAISLGATPARSLWQVTLPLIRPGVRVGALYHLLRRGSRCTISVGIWRGHVTTTHVGRCPPGDQSKDRGCIVSHDPPGGLAAWYRTFAAQSI